MVRKCVICGKEFNAPASSKKITCSKECSSIRKSQSHAGKHFSCSAAGRDSARRAAEKTGNLKNGVIAAQKLPKCQRGPQNQGSKIYYLRDPSGNTIKVINLLDWSRRHAKDYFDMEPTDHNAKVIANGFRNIKRSMEGKLFHRGKPRSAYTYKGWSLVSWSDKPLE